MPTKKDLMEIHARLLKVHVLGEDVENYYVALATLTKIINEWPSSSDEGEE